MSDITYSPQYPSSTELTINFSDADAFVPEKDGYGFVETVTLEEGDAKHLRDTLNCYVENEKAGLPCKTSHDLDGSASRVVLTREADLAVFTFFSLDGRRKKPITVIKRPAKDIAHMIRFSLKGWRP